MSNPVEIRPTQKVKITQFIPLVGFFINIRETKRKGLAVPKRFYFFNMVLFVFPLLVTSALFIYFAFTRGLTNPSISFGISSFSTLGAMISFPIVSVLETNLVLNPNNRDKKYFTFASWERLETSNPMEVFRIFVTTNYNEAMLWVIGSWIGTSIYFAFLTFV